ncbi:MAG: arginase family protein [Saprospiraceae bacterium]
MVGLVGGEHSVPLGFLDALADKHKSFGILQIDAHMDLRKPMKDLHILMHPFFIMPCNQNLSKGWSR